MFIVFLYRYGAIEGNPYAVGAGALLTAFYTVMVQLKEKHPPQILTLQSSFYTVMVQLKGSFHHSIAHRLTSFYTVMVQLKDIESKLQFSTFNSFLYRYGAIEG